MKKILAITLALVLIISIIPTGFLGITASAETEYKEGDYKYTISYGGATITYCYIGGDITIPSTLGGYPVKKIGNYAFQFRTSLTSVIIPDCVESIGTSAFYNCISLTGVIIGNGIISIGDSSFKNCTNLKEVSIPNSVTSIGDYSFTGCTSLTSVTIPNNVTSIGERAFYGCTNLTRLNFNATNCVSMGREGSNPAFGACPNLKEINIGEDVTNIPAYAFSECVGVTSIIIPKSVKKVGDFAFGDCSNLEKVTLNAINCTQIGSRVLRAFENCTKLKSITIGDGVEQIPAFAFLNCDGITNINIPESVTKIGVSAFESCGSLSSIILSNGVRNINANAFSNCSNLKNINIPDSVSIIGHYAFSNCSNFENINIPDSVSSVGDGVFSGCRKLLNVNIGSGISTIPREMFFRCESIENIHIPNNITEIGPYAFAYNAFKNIVIPNSVVRMGEGVFYMCSHLESITIPFVGSSRTANKTRDAVFGYIFDDYDFSSESGGGKTAQGYDHYSGATYYAYYFIPSSVKYVAITDASQIPVGAFCGCSNIRAITISNTVTNIDIGAFRNCPSLTDIWYMGSENEKPKIHTSNSISATWHYDSCIRSSTHSYGDDKICDVCGRKAYALGNIDGVEGVTDADAEYLLMYTFFPDDYPVNQECDFNGDGKVNDADAEHLLMYTFFPEDYPLN